MMQVPGNNGEKPKNHRKIGKFPEFGRIFEIFWKFSKSRTGAPLRGSGNSKNPQNADFQICTAALGVPESFYILFPQNFAENPKEKDQKLVKLGFIEYFKI